MSDTIDYADEIREHAWKEALKMHYATRRNDGIAAIDCVDCGCKIPRAYHKVQLYVKRCMECQTRFEQR